MRESGPNFSPAERKRRLLLAVGALIGVVATPMLAVFLIVALASQDDTRRMLGFVLGGIQAAVLALGLYLVFSNLKPKPN